MPRSNRRLRQAESCMNYQWGFEPVFRYGNLLVDGLIGTLVLVALSLLIALPLGLALALLRMARVTVLSVRSKKE